MCGSVFATLGTEQVLNGDFFVDAIWVKPSGWTISGGKASLVSTGFGINTLTQSLPSLVEGTTYEITYTIDAMETVGLGYLEFYFGDTRGNLQLIAGTFTEQIIFSGSAMIEFYPMMAVGSTCVIDNVSVREVIATELTADYDDDGLVGLSDLLLFSADWLAEDPAIVTVACDHNSDGVVNLADYAVLSQQWGLGSINQAPTAVNQAVTVTVGSVVQFTLSASDPDGDYLSYLITQAPTQGTLISMGGGVYRYRPYLEAESTDTFIYKVSDGRLESDPATVTITIVPQILDTVKYDGRARIEVEDGGNIVMGDEFILTCWFRTKWPLGALEQAQPRGGPGVVVTVMIGVIVVSRTDKDQTNHRRLDRPHR
jgi:hypothetical protein